jgi:hypothetical protein
MRTIWSFGCSFTSGYLDISKEQSYPHLVSESLGVNINNTAKPGNCNDKIHYDLVKNINNINEDDIIIYQFSSFNRIGFFKNADPNSYFSSAGIPELGTKHKSKEKEFHEYNLKELDDLLAFILTWQPRRLKMIFETTFNLLNYIKENKKTHNIILFLTNEFLYFNDNVLLLPYQGNMNNLSINDYLNDNGLTLGHEFPSKYPYGDTHPGYSGHKHLAEKILNKLK